MNARTRIFGNAPRVSIRNDYCRASSLAADDPEAHQVIANFAHVLDEQYKSAHPELYARHARQVDRVLPEWRIGSSVFTSGIINENNPLPYHFDAGNFAGVWSNMLALRADVEGGHLAVPAFDCAFAIGDRTLLMFDGQGLLHGVTPMKRTSATGYRYTLVYYSLKDMWACETSVDETRRYQHVRTLRERKRGGR
jgi:hypothetical protein